MVVDNFGAYDKKTSTPYSNGKHFPLQSSISNTSKSSEVSSHVQKYLRSLKEVMAMESYSSKKILKKTL